MVEAASGVEGAVAVGAARGVVEGEGTGARGRGRGPARRHRATATGPAPIRSGSGGGRDEGVRGARGEVGIGLRRFVRRVCVAAHGRE